MFTWIDTILEVKIAVSEAVIFMLADGTVVTGIVFVGIFVVGIVEFGTQVVGTA